MSSTSMLTVSRPAGDLPALRASSPSRWGIPYRRAAAWLTAAWLVPATTHLLSADWLLPPLGLLLTAGLLRGGRTLLDRLVLATGLLLGATTMAGLVLSVWPFGLEPVAVAGAGFTLLALVGLVSRRPARLPRPRMDDALVAAAALGVVGYLARPYIRGDRAQLLAMIMLGEDNVRHFSAYESIRSVGGYLFLHPASAWDSYEGMRFYPQGWHLVSGLLDNFVRSATDLGPGPNAFTHYAGFTLAGYGLFTLALMWGVQWLAGPLLTGWRRLPVLGLLALYCLYDDPLRRLIRGYPAEVLGLALLVLLVAVVCRPVSSTRDQTILVGGLLAGVGFMYFFLLPAAGLAALAWFVRWRRRVLRHRAFAAGLAMAAAAATVPLALGVLLGGLGGIVVQPYTGARTSRDIMIALAAIAAAGGFTPAGRRLRVWRSYRWAVAAVLAPAAAIYAYQQAVTGSTSYYLEKALWAGNVTLLVGVGAVVLLLPPPRRAPEPQLRRRLAAALPAVFLTLATAAALGVIKNDSPYRPTTGGPAPNWGRAWVAGHFVTPKLRQLAAYVMAADASFPHREGTVTLVLSDYWFSSYLGTLHLAALQRHSRESAKAVYGDGLARVRTLDDLKQLLLGLPMPIRIVAVSPETAAVAEAVQRLRPPGQVELLARWG